MNHKRISEFAEAFEIDKEYVGEAYTKLSGCHDFEFNDVELTAYVEESLFNLLGIVSGKTNIWSVDNRAALAKEILETSLRVFENKIFVISKKRLIIMIEQMAAGK